GDEVIVTSPRGGLIQQYNLADNVLTNSIDLLDASGAAMTDMGVMISTGTGALVNVAQGKTVNRQIAGLQWDNHLVSITAG
ncbi:DUF1513 domain-containing protein, partial [Yoonia sp.]|uniref:DUF1513 domain-containing protein n=1 Tax=Yoonia sp. TaxID=2212373 RepID=UPI0023998065